MDIINLGKNAKKAAVDLAKLSQDEKKEALLSVAKALEDNSAAIIEANNKDLENADNNGMRPAMRDRLALDEDRIKGMAGGVRQVALLKDPIGEIIDTWTRPNGLEISRVRVPIGVIGIVYEARPNVTSDAFAISFKTGNACVLRGGSDSINSSVKIGEIMREALEAKGINPDCVQIMDDPDRKYVTELLHLTDYIDLIIPRGSERLIDHVVDNSTVPVIKTGTGNNHVYVDEFADIDMAVDIVDNAKTQRISVCNALENVIVHKAVKDEFLPKLYERFEQKKVEMRGDEVSVEVCPGITPATDEDWSTEYLDYIIAVKTVGSIEEAIEHINRYNTGHSDTIVTENRENADRFLREIDSACVYVNASTRFSDGEEFGFGAEIGISTQKIHARGPMGLEQMTSYKYCIRGNGQTR